MLALFLLGWRATLVRTTQGRFYELVIGVPLAGRWTISGSERASRLFSPAPSPDPHVAVALKHHFVDRDGLLARTARRRPGRSA